MKKLKIDDIIETSRLLIQMPKIEDAEEIYNLLNDDVTKYMTWEKWSSYKEIEKNIKESIIDCKKRKSFEAIIKFKDNTIIWKFWVNFYKNNIRSAHLWYWIWKKYWWNWYIPECVEAFKKIFFEQYKYNRIIIRCIKENVNSIRVAEKCGFKLDWILRWQSIVNWKIIDKAFYTFLREDYIKN